MIEYANEGRILHLKTIENGRSDFWRQPMEVLNIAVSLEDQGSLISEMAQD
jgi:hypothetical protein